MLGPSARERTTASRLKEPRRSTNCKGSRSAFQGLKSGSIAIQNALTERPSRTRATRRLDLVGIALHGQLPHAFHVAVLQGMAGLPWSGLDHPELYRDLFHQ